MAELITLTANWTTGKVSSGMISRQYDNNRYCIKFTGIPDDGGENLIYYLLIYMKTEEGAAPVILAPVQLASDEWIISNYFTQIVQQIKFQLCVQNEGGTFEAHSPIFDGSIRDSLDHDGEDIDIDTSELFDYYRAYVEERVSELIVAAGAVQIDTSLSVAGAAAEAKAVGDALSSTNERLKQVADVSVVDGKLVINGTSYELGGTGIVSITKTGTSGLVDTYTILFTDGTSTTFTVTNGDASDAKIQGFIEDWLEEHPEATTTVQDGAITLEKLAPEVTQKLSDVKLNYKWIACGYMRNHVKEFQGWAQNVVWAPELGCAVGIVISGVASHTSEQPWYRVTIDPSGYMSTYEAITVFDTDGVTPYTPARGYMGCTKRLNDGSYMCIDIDQTIYKSTDSLKTLVKQRQIEFTRGSDGSMFSLTELSNGRLIIGHGGWVNGFWYSDDSGATWTNVIPSASNLGRMIYPESQYKPFEPCFIECGNGKVLAIGRKSMNGMGEGPVTEATYALKEPAVYSISEDYGSTWTAWANSQTITDMTACNGKPVVIDGIVHLVFGSRWKNTEKGCNFQLFYTFASIDDAVADNWATPVPIDIGQWNDETATNSHDSGYPSLWTDGVGNLYSVHYDGDGTGSAFGANWRLCIGSPAVKKPAVSPGNGAYNVAYSQRIIDQKIAALMAKINELYLLIGEIPDDSGEYDGSSLIFNGLKAWFDVTATSKWNDAVLTSMVGDLTAVAKISTASGVISAGGGNVSPAQFENGFAEKVGLLYFDKTFAEIVGSDATAITVEFIVRSSVNAKVFYTKSTSAVNASLNNNPNVFTSPGSSELFSNEYSVPYHTCAVFEEGKVTWYVNGSRKKVQTIDSTFANIMSSYPLPNAHNSLSNGALLGDIRFYNRVLSEQEIMNNFLFTQTEVDYSVTPVFE